MISLPGPTVHSDLRLPSHPNGIVIPTNEIPSYIPIKMRRKVFVVNDHMAAGVSGSALHIDMFINDLTAEFACKNEFSYSSVTSFLDSYSSGQHGNEIFELIRAIIVVEAMDWQGHLVVGRTSHQSVNSRNFGKVAAVGSGASSIVEEINRLDNSYKYGFSQPADGDERFPEFSSLARNLTLLANIYWKEFVTPANVFEAWGGAYDLIYQDANRVFRYLDDYTIFLRLYDGANSEMGIQLMNVLKYERRSEVSFILMLNDGKLDYFGAKDITASDEPITIRLGKGDLTMNSGIHISIIAVGHGNRFLPPIIQIDGLSTEGDSKQTVFTDFDDDGRLRVLFHSQHDDWLKGQTISYYDENKHLWA